MKQIAFLLLVVGCVETEMPAVETVFAPPVYDEEMQGRHILGHFPDTLISGTQHFRVSRVPVNRPAFTLSVNAAGPLGVNGSNLVATNGVVRYTNDDSWFGGLVLSGPAGAELKITGSVRRGASTLYTLKYRDGINSAWVDYCDGDGGAIPLQGGFSDRRIHTTGNTISFACLDGVAEKCDAWGYVPGVAGAGNVEWDHHQACIQMANAAYCGGALSGLPFTREETPIVIQDFRPGYAKGDPTLTSPTTFPGDPDTHYFEAAWRPNGLAPLCLSKLRWSSLPPNPCPGVLRDPRYDPSPEAKYCDDMTYTDLEAMGALLINGSKMMDARLHRWRNTKGDTVTTMRGFYSTIPGESIPPDGYPEYVGSDGMILRNLTGTLDADVDMVPLYLQHEAGTGNLVVSDGVKLPGHDYDPARDADFEGYAFVDQSRIPGLLPLTVCQLGVNYDTTIGVCPSASVAGPMFALP